MYVQFGHEYDGIKNVFYHFSNLLLAFYILEPRLGPKDPIMGWVGF
jgi:hypothetical protein